MWGLTWTLGPSHRLKGLLSLAYRGCWIKSGEWPFYLCTFVIHSFRIGSGGDAHSDRFMSDWHSGVRIQINTSCPVCYYILNCSLKRGCVPGAATQDTNRIIRSDLLWLRRCVSCCKHLQIFLLFRFPKNVIYRVSLCNFALFFFFSFPACMSNSCQLSLISVATNRGKRRRSHQWSLQVSLLCFWIFLFWERFWKKVVTKRFNFETSDKSFFFNLFKL